MTTAEWKQLLTLLLSQRLEINAIESALKTARILTDTQVKEIRTQASVLLRRGVRVTATMYWHSFECIQHPARPCLSRRNGRNEMPLLFPALVRESPED